MELNVDLEVLQMDAEQASKLAFFKEGLDKIEKRHQHYFSHRQHKYLIKPDLLRYHYVISKEAGKILFDFIEDTDLDFRIKEECLALYQSIYDVSVRE